LDPSEVEELMSAHPHLHELDTSECKLNRGSALTLLQQLTLVLAHPAAQQLRILRLNHRIGSGVQANWTPEVLVLLLALAHLHTLIVAPLLSDPVDWVQFAYAPALTSLTIHDSNFQPRMTGLAACPHLRSLHLVQP
jgi:hypothetical protein